MVKLYNTLAENMKRRNSLEELAVNMRIILKMHDVNWTHL
jgi:hypothetical protein